MTTTNITITKEDIINEIKLSGQLPQIINQIIDRRLLSKAIANLKIVIEDQELQIAADQFREFNNLITAKDTLLWLQDNSLDIQDLETIAESSLGTQKLAQELFSSAIIEKYFYENKVDYESVVMYEILLSNKDLAVEILYAIQEGELTFAEAAKRYITDQDLRRKGGYLGAIGRSSLLPEISAAVSTAQPPQLLKPISTRYGTHLIFVEEVIEAKLNSKTTERIVADLFFQWLQKQKADVDIIKAY